MGACLFLCDSLVALLTIATPVFSALNWQQNSSCGLRCSLGVLLNTKLWVATRNRSWIGICLEMIFYFLVLQFWKRKKKKKDWTWPVYSWDSKLWGFHLLPPPPQLLKMAKQMGLGEKPIAGIGPLGGCSQCFSGEGNPHRDDKGTHSCWFKGRETNIRDSQPSQITYIWKRF